MTDKKDKRKGWLAELEVGSVVLLDRGSYHTFPTPAKVQKITPTGRMEVLGAKYSPEGREIGGYGWNTFVLREPTSEALHKCTAWKVLKNLEDKVSKVLRCETYAERCKKADLLQIRKLETAIDHLGDVLYEVQKK